MVWYGVLLFCAVLHPHREFSYSVRVQILEAVDRAQRVQPPQRTGKEPSSIGSSTRVEGSDSLPSFSSPPDAAWGESLLDVDCTACTNDLRRVLLRLGAPWALAREAEAATLASGGSSRLHRRQGDSGNGFFEEDFKGAGAIS